MRLLLLLVGLAGCLIFQSGYQWPVVVSVLLFGLATASVVILAIWHRIGPLVAILYIVYGLPFIHLVPYVWFDYGSAPQSLWGLAVNPYMTDKSVIERMGGIGALGAIGFAWGAWRSEHPPKIRFHAPRASAALPVLGLGTFLALLIAALILSWLAAPKDTLLTARYTESISIAESANFQAAWMISYSLLTLLTADFLAEWRGNVGRIKRAALVSAVGFIVIWLQVLRGDRDSFPLLAGIMTLYYIWGRGLPGAAPSSRGVPWLKILGGGVGIFVLAYFVGVFRSSIAGVTSTRDAINVFDDLKAIGAIGVDNLLTGTWSAVLLTPLSVAGDQLAGTLPLRSGATYIDFMLSIIPGIIADGLGYVRPIDAMRGPAWDMTFGQGGTHAVVVPFMNFRIFGVFGIIAAWSFLLAKIEDSVLRRRTVISLSFLGIICMASPHWLWYGEKYIINAIIIWGLCAFMHKVLAIDGTSIRIEPAARIKSAPHKQWRKR